MTYLVAISFGEQFCLADITKPTLEDAMNAAWVRYPTARAVTLAPKDQRASTAPKPDDLFRLVIKRAAPLELPNSSFRGGENVAKKLFLNVLENPNAKFIRWDEKHYRDWVDKVRAKALRLTDDYMKETSSILDKDNKLDVREKARACLKACNVFQEKVQFVMTEITSIVEILAVRQTDSNSWDAIFYFFDIDFRVEPGFYKTNYAGANSARKDHDKLMRRLDNTPYYEWEGVVRNHIATWFKLRDYTNIPSPE